MRCPDWSSLVAHRYALSGEEPADWWEALAHLKSCAQCREEALEADPTLLFVDQLPISEVREPAISAGEVVARARQGAEGGRSVSRIWLAAAAALLMILGLAHGARRLALPAPETGSMSSLLVAEAPVASTLPALMELPMVEAFENTESRIYQVAAGELDFVVIVDAGLELQDESLDL